MARLALLACTLLGLAAMHSLGHGGGTHAAMRVDHHAALDMATNATSAAASDDCPDRGCARLGALPPGTGGGMSDWGVCLAVLSALAAATLLAALLLQRSARGPANGTGGDHLLGASRAPPGRTPPTLGLILAEASVLRR